MTLARLDAAADRRPGAPRSSRRRPGTTRARSSPSISPRRSTPSPRSCPTAWSLRRTARPASCSPTGARRATTTSACSPTPAIGQYHEAYVVLHALRGDKKVGRVPFIWVDSELSLLRGQIQGFPKKLGQIAMTRPVELGRGGVRKQAGATLRRARHQPRAARAHAPRVTLEGTAERLPQRRDLAAGAHAAVSRRSIGPSRRCTSSSSAPSPTSSAARSTPARRRSSSARPSTRSSRRSRPIAVGAGYVFSMAFSVLGGKVEPL